MKLPKKAGFIGLGLIGGSIAMNLKALSPSIKIIAHANHKETLEQAFQEGLTDNSDFLPLSAFASCDLLFLCAPVKYNMDYLQKIAPLLQPECLITDVGSVKGQMQQTAEKLGLSDRFLAGHPMCGSEEIGLSAASPELIRGAYYILTPGDPFPKEKTKNFCEILTAFGCIPLVMSTKEHDFATAAISHLPHIVSAALIETAAENETKNHTLSKIAAGGFRDITRISSSSPVMWQQIALANKDEILHLMDLYETQFLRFKRAIEQEDQNELLSLFSSAKTFRDSLPAKEKETNPD